MVVVGVCLVIWAERTSGCTSPTLAPLVLVTRKDLPYADAKALIAFATANPDKVTYASGGRGTGQHIAMAVTGQLAGVKLLHVPYRGAQPAYQDILGGRIDLFFDNVSTALPLIDDDRVKVLAVSSAVRHPRLPNIPTIAETGVADLFLEQLYTFGDPERDPRGWVVSVAYYALVSPDKYQLHGATDASNARWFALNELPELAFDHDLILRSALERYGGRSRGWFDRLWSGQLKANL